MGRVGLNDVAAPTAPRSGFLAFDVGAVDVEVDRQFFVEEFWRQVDTYCSTLEVGFDYDTFVIVIGCRNAVWQEAYCSADAEVIVVRNGSAEHFFLPVGVSGAKHSDGSGCAYSVCHEIGEFGCVHHVECLAGCCHVDVCCKVHLRASALAALGGDYYDAV